MAKVAIVASAICFGTALGFAKDGYLITREGWNGRGMFVKLQVPDENSKMQRPYLYMSPVDGALVPWVASQSDLLADDWLALEEVPEQDTDCAQNQLLGEGQAAAPSTMSAAGIDPAWQEQRNRMECLHTAVGLVASGKSKASDPLELAREFFGFVQGK